MRDKEKLELLSNIEKMKREDADAAAAKRERINTLMRQAAEANSQSLVEKDKRATEAKDLDNEIATYQRAKDAKEYEAQLEA